VHQRRPGSAVASTAVKTQHACQLIRSRAGE
jgi:hypothetical protein